MDSVMLCEAHEETSSKLDTCVIWGMLVIAEFNGDMMVDRHMERLGGRDRLYVQMLSAMNTDRPKENLDLALRAHGRSRPKIILYTGIS
jgi:hypothetical protein